MFQRRTRASLKNSVYAYVGRFPFKMDVSIPRKFENRSFGNGNLALIHSAYRHARFSVSTASAYF